MSQIKAKIIADSINAYTGVRLTTYEVESYRPILAELNTHRVFSRNAESSRAVPVMKMISKVWNDPYMPIWWGKNQAGMQAKEELTGFRLTLAKFAWVAASKIACISAYALSKVGMHKQLTNRLIESWMITKGVISTTEDSNWFELRMHKDAQPEIKALAEAMFKAKSQSTPKILYRNQWHLPYVKTAEDGVGEFSSQQCYDEIGNKISLDLAKKISASCCAQVSYRKNDPSVEKAESIFDKLINSKPRHFSPAEHQATPIQTQNREIFSANFRNWKQFRTFIEEQPNKVF